MSQKRLIIFNSYKTKTKESIQNSNLLDKIFYLDRI
jgi:hypothetical protein